MNPVLLKPGSDQQSQVVLLGQPVAEVDAVEYRDQAATLLEVALDAWRSCAATRRGHLRGRRQPGRDQPPRRPTSRTWAWPGRRDLPVIVVGDIDRGGVFAAMYGTLALLERPTRR